MVQWERSEAYLLHGSLIHREGWCLCPFDVDGNEDAESRKFNQVPNASISA
jgi:hypothetical protein